MINSANTTVIKTTTDINELRRENQKIQKNGAPFMLASVILWALIAVVRILPITLYAQNLFTFCCSMLLIPLAFIFSKIIGADIFKKTENPINKLGFLCTMNQMLYLLIVMWAFSQNPEVFEQDISRYVDRSDSRFTHCFQRVRRIRYVRLRNRMSDNHINFASC